MPFDGNFLPGSPIGRLIDAQRARTLESERWEARRRYAKAKLPTHLVPPPDTAHRRMTKARESIVVLHSLEELLDDGGNWCQNRFHDGYGGHCLIGGLRHIRAGRGAGDHAGVYLSKAIAGCFGEKGTVIDFNDSRSSYAEIGAVIVLARELAQRVVDTDAAQMELRFPALS